MTRLKTKIENRSSLAKFAKILGIDEYMIISRQVEDNNGRDSDKLLEDCFESFVGALFLDLGFEVPFLLANAIFLTKLFFIAFNCLIVFFISFSLTFLQPKERWLGFVSYF